MLFLPVNCYIKALSVIFVFLKLFCKVCRRVIVGVIPSPPNPIYDAPSFFVSSRPIPSPRDAPGGAGLQLASHPSVHLRPQVPGHCPAGDHPWEEPRHSTPEAHQQVIKMLQWQWQKSPALSSASQAFKNNFSRSHLIHLMFVQLLQESSSKANTAIWQTYASVWRNLTPIVCSAGSWVTELQIWKES